MRLRNPRALRRKASSRPLMGVGGDDFLIDHVCHLDRDVFLGVEHAGQPVMLAGRKQLRAGAGDAPNPIQWVAGMAAPAEGLLLDALADQVELGPGQRHYVERMPCQETPG